MDAGTIFAGEAGVLNATPDSLGGFFIWYVGTDFAHLGWMSTRRAVPTPNPPLSAGPFLRPRATIAGRSNGGPYSIFFPGSRNASPTIVFGTVAGIGWHVLTRVAPMIRKEYEYRRNAIATVELARRAASPADKAHLLKLAEAWLELATVTHRQSGQRVRSIGEHPLVRAKLGAQRAA